ncbi:MAG: hypothetical protein M0030_32670 [Actinomycetota bacterium]|nr:hypothetical protein [Actinomycetota bacterium]
MKLSKRFGLDILFVVGAAFLVAAAMAFSTPVLGWVGFGVFTGLTVIAAASAVMTRRRGQKIGHGIIGAVGLWALIAALVFSGPVMMWLVFADAIGIGVLALADLTVHESMTENVVHRLEVTQAPAEAPHRMAV